MIETFVGRALRFHSNRVRRKTAGGNGLRLRRNRDVAATLYTNLQTRSAEAQLAEASATPDVRVLDTAIAPLLPGKNTAPRMMLLAILGGIGAALGLAILLDRLDPKLRYPEQATDELGLPIAGSIPRFPKQGVGSNSPEQMFQLIEYARMFVGTKAIATLSAGYQVALGYAKERVQGADLTATSKDAPRVTITHHPDVRRSLMLQKAYAEGMRALYHYAATFRDQVIQAQAEGAGDSEEARLAERVNDLLLPIVKGFGSERATQLLTAESLQTLGGSGYLQDYPIEQYIRDSKIDTLYEGTTAIQGQDFFFRKIVRDGGVALTWLAGQMQATIDAEAGNGRLKEERAYLTTALSDVQGMLTALFDRLTASQQDITKLYEIAQNTSRLLLAAGDLITGWLLVRQAEVALAALGGEVSEPDRLFYEGKLAATRFFCTQVLPKLTAERVLVEHTDNALMEVDEAAL